jgi:branched-chain amino acid transport system permease protein
MLIFSVYAMSLDLLIGYLGYTSFGHAAFFATGSYAVVVAALRLGESFWQNSLIALAVVIAVAMVFGLIALRTSGLPFIMITLALGQAVWGLSYRWVSVTGGDNGLSGLRRPVLPVIGRLEDSYAFYYFVLVVFAAVVVLLILLTRSPLGLSWRGIRDSEPRMRVLGYNTWLHKYLAYVLSALFGGVAGILQAYQTGFVSPQSAFFSNSATAILSVILGGPGTLLGASIGASVVVLIRQLVSSYTERWALVLGAVYIITVMCIPGGLLGLASRLIARARRQPTGMSSPTGSSG